LNDGLAIAITGGGALWVPGAFVIGCGGRRRRTTKAATSRRMTATVAPTMTAVRLPPAASLARLALVPEGASVGMETPLI
jgi:hypothetical protein